MRLRAYSPSCRERVFSERSGGDSVVGQYADTLIRMGAAAAPSTRRTLTLALSLYLLWVLATYLLEGRILTLQRSEATGARLAYALVANILVGIGGSVLVVRFLSNSGEISAPPAPLPGRPRAAGCVVGGGGVG